MKELPPGVMKAMTNSPRNSSWTPKGPGSFSARTLGATWLTPPNSELQGRPAWSTQRDKLQAPGSQGGALWT